MLFTTLNVSQKNWDAFLLNFDIFIFNTYMKKVKNKYFIFKVTYLSYCTSTAFYLLMLLCLKEHFWDLEKDFSVAYFFYLIMIIIVTIFIYCENFGKTKEMYIFAGSLDREKKN